MTTPILLVELTPKTGGQVIRLASQPYRHPSAPGFYRDAILERSRVRREIFADGVTFGASSHDYGTLRVANVTGWLDWLEDADVDAYGGSIVMHVLPDVTSPYSARKTVFTGRLGEPQVSDTVEFRVLDDFALALDKQLAKRRWLGTNVGPTGLEGDESQKDQWYPVLEGRAFNCPVPWANTSNLVLCVADKAVAAILLDAVDDRGVALTRGVARASLAALESNTPAAGQWDYYLGDATTPAHVRLGSSPAGTVTVTMRSGGVAADRTAAQIWRRVLISRAGIDAGAISSADVTALDALTSAEVGFWVGAGGAQIREMLDFVAGSVGAGYWQDRTGTWRIARIDLPSGDPVATFRLLGLGNPGAVGDADIFRLEPVFTSREDGGRPYDLTKLRYAKNYSPTDKNSLAGVALDRAERLSKEYLETAYPAGVTEPENEYVADTAFALEADAAAEAQRRDGIFGARRRRHKISTRLSPALADVLDLNAVVRVEHPRYGFASGPLARVSALEIDLLSLDADVIVWR